MMQNNIKKSNKQTPQSREAADTSYGQRSDQTVGYRSLASSMNRELARHGLVSYQLRDLSLENQIIEAIDNFERVAIGDVDVKVRNGHVTLSGAVCDHATKWMVEELCAQVAPEATITNNLDVDRDAIGHCQNIS